MIFCAAIQLQTPCFIGSDCAQLGTRVKLDNAAGLLALKNHRKNRLHSDEEAGDSDEVNVPLESPARILTVVTSDAPLPSRRPPCPPVSPADSAAARKLGVSWQPSPAPKRKIKRQAADSVDHGTLRVKLEELLGTIQVSRPHTQTPKRNAHSRSPSVPSVSLWADGTPPHSSRMASLPSEASAVSGAGTPSTRPLSTAGAPSSSHDGIARSPPKTSRSRRALSVHSDTSSVEFISRVLMDDEGADADAMPGVEPPPLSPTITSASSVDSCTTFGHSCARFGYFCTTFGGAYSEGDLDLMMVDEDDDQQGPFFLNVTTLTMYRDMSVAMSDMEKLEKLQVFGSAQEVKEAMEQVMQKQDFFSRKGKGKQFASPVSLDGNMPGNDSPSITPHHTPCPRSPNTSDGNTVPTASPPLPHTPSASPSASPVAGGIPLPSALPSLLHLHDGHDDGYSALGPDDDEEPWEGIPEHANLPAGPDDDEEPWGGILEHDGPDNSEEPWGGISDDTVDPPSQKSKTAVPYLGDGDESELPDIDGLTTWTSRNPGKSVVPVLSASWAQSSDELRATSGRTPKAALQR
ncbi:hypothetical protein K438DRAFT_1777034 [Mycena galopus ATCC 62051]|nr:hypothetical protein K438DRAFT_1777034 [Mycena galopus ATCC 62051]